MPLGHSCLHVLHEGSPSEPQLMLPEYCPAGHVFLHCKKQKPCKLDAFEQLLKMVRNCVPLLCSLDLLPITCLQKIALIETQNVFPRKERHTHIHTLLPDSAVGEDMSALMLMAQVSLRISSACFERCYVSGALWF
jgi:hypothetical protein